MSDVVYINNKQLEAKSLFAQRVITFRDIDKLHERPEGTASRNFSANRKHFIEGEDCFYLSGAEMQSTNFANYYSPKGLVLLTESGYLMLVKSFTDDLAWKVQKELVNGYFRAKIQPQIATTQTEALLQAAQILAQQEKQIKQLAAAQAESNSQLQVLNHRVDSLDAVNTDGDHRQRLNRMVQKYARQKGIMFRVAWNEFKQSFNLAYRTNLELLILNFEKKTGMKKVTIPQYLAATNKLADGIRVADKLLNAA